MKILVDVPDFELDGCTRTPTGALGRVLEHDRIDELFRSVAELNAKLCLAMDSGGEQYKELSRKLASIRDRLKFHEHDEHDGLAKRIEALEKRVDDIGLVADGAHIRIDLHTEQINELDQALLRAQCDPRLVKPSPKRILNGGWTNVYLAPGKGTARTDSIWSTKEAADTYAKGDSDYQWRVACIQIPDITEGEGL